MLIGVISDSHDNLPMLDKALEKLINNKVELVIHLGDIISPFTIRRMHEKLGNVKVVAVLGNNDGDVYLLKKLFTQYNWELYSGPSLVEVDGRSFIIMHGFNGIEHTEKIARQLLGYPGISGVLYGHTHKRVYERINDKILLNPGEVCGYLTGKPSIALLDTSDLSVELIDL